jgi:outer membrane receptor protein involved in Fe transport
MNVLRIARKFNFLIFALAVFAVLFAFTKPAMAQATTGTLKGSVVDPQGAAIAGATVSVKNEATSIVQTTTATSDGLFAVTNLAPGKYTVMVSTNAGFSTKQVTGVDVRIGTETDIKVELAVGTPTETVTITGNTEEIVQTTSQISASFESRKVEELPSNAAGGGLDTLALLAPGVVPGFGNVNSNGTTLSVNGNRARANNFTLDGTDNNDLTIGGPNFFISNQDSIQEFQVITNNYSAQFGRNQGAVINYVTKSGTNEFHGSGFEFHRNSSALDAMTNQQRSDPKRSRRDKFISNVFGGTFGGPIVKNKLFFFGDTQFIRQRQSFTFNAGNPVITPAGLQALAAAYPGNAAVAAITNQSLFALQPNARIRSTASSLCFPRNPSLTFSCNPASADFANGLSIPTAFVDWDIALPYNQKEYGLRGDFNPNSRNSFNAKYRFQESPETNTVSSSNGFFGDIPFSSKNLNGAWTRQIGGHYVNDLRVAWQKLSVIFGGGCSDPLKGCVPDAADIDKSFTNITFTGITASGTTLQSIGPATNLPQGRQVRVFQISDTFSWTKGKHTALFGVDFRDLDNSVPFLPNINGAFRFNSTTRIAQNFPNFVTLGAGEPRISYKERDQFYFMQDDWRVLDNLTLNLGLRYEYTGAPINLLNKLTVKRESDPATALWRQSLPIGDRTVPAVPTDNNNLAPRVGFAWSPRFGSGRLARLIAGENDATVIRGGFSIAYEPAFYNILLNVSTAAPTVFLNTINNTGTAASPGFRLPSNPTGDVVRSALGSFLQRNTFDPRLLSQTIVSPDFHSPFSRQWSLGIQRQVNRNNVAEVRYVGNAGRELFQTVNRNPFIANLVNGFTSAGFGGTTFTFPGFPNLVPPGITMVPFSGNDPATADNEAADDGRIIAGRGLIRARENSGSSIYHGLQARYNGRLANQLTVGASYTWSKTIDNVSEIFSFGEIAIASNPFDLKNNERGLSGNDRRHAFSTNFLYDIPWFKSQNGFAGKTLGGWQFNGTYVLTSGRPFTPSEFFNVFGAPTYQDFNFTAGFFGFDNVRAFTGNRNAPRDSVGITDVDASYFGFTGVFTPSSTGFYSFNELNRTGNLLPVTQDQVRFIFNGPGAARRFGNPFGNVPRNGERGPALNILNLGIFKNTKIGERVNIQFRAELFNALNHPNPGYGVAGEDTLPDTFIEDAGLYGVSDNRTGFNDRRAMELSSRRVQFGLRIVF